jgi:hypothetical protein
VARSRGTAIRYVHGRPGVARAATGPRLPLPVLADPDDNHAPASDSVDGLEVRRLDNTSE